MNLNILSADYVSTNDIKATGITTVDGLSTNNGYVYISRMSTIAGITTETRSTFFAKDVTASGISTLSNVVVGGATTELVVGGDTRVTGVITANVLSAESFTTQYRIPFVGAGNTLVESGSSVYTDGTSINATTFNASSFLGDGAVITSVQATTFTGGADGLTGLKAESFNNAGIGTVKGLEITGLTTTNLLYSNNVGVGTTNPTSDLEVKKPDSFVQFVGETGISIPFFDKNGYWRGTRAIGKDVTLDRYRDIELAAAQNRERVISFITQSVREAEVSRKGLDPVLKAITLSLAIDGCQIIRLKANSQREVMSTFGAMPVPISQKIDVGINNLSLIHI